MSEAETILSLQAKIDQMMGLIHDLQQQRDDAVEREAVSQAELESQLAQKDERVKWLEKAYLQAKNTNRWTEDMINHPHIQQTRDRVLINELTKRTMRVSPGPDGKWRTSTGELSSATNLTKGAVLDGIKSVRTMGIEIETEDIPGKGNHKRYVYSIPQEIKDNPRDAIKPPTDSNYGGTREIILCPNCGSSKNAHSKRNRCTDCHHEWGEPWKANNKEGASQAHEDMKDTPPEQPNEDLPEEEIQHHMDTLFPDEEKSKAKATPPKGSFEDRDTYKDEDFYEDDPFSPPTPTCIVCRKPKWVWDEGLATYTCGTDHTKEEASG